MGGVDDGYRCIRFAALPADPIFSNKVLFRECPGLVGNGQAAFRRKLAIAAVPEKHGISRKVAFDAAREAAG